MKWLGIGILAALVVSCDLADKVTDSGSPDTSPDEPDIEGNFIIRNATAARLVLFNGESRLKVIPGRWCEVESQVERGFDAAEDFLHHAIGTGGVLVTAAETLS